MSSDTIFALATGAGRAAVAVIRMSGRKAGEVLDGLCRRPASRQATLRLLRHDGAALDQALVLWFPAPASYTGEDCAELQLHGGPAVVAAVADALVTLGARPAEPGEFTRRAFVHGKMDLTAAEGIADLIDAETEAQRRQALRQAGGALAARHAEWAAQLTRLLARQEAFIEFEAEDLPAGLDEAVAREAAALRDALAAEIAEGSRGEALREGLRIAILGAPNAGKSSLLNALAGRDAAIVSPQAGTTRDVVQVRLVLAGVPVTLSDTAGLRVSCDAIEAEGVRRARAEGSAADLVIAVFAADAEPDWETLALVEAGALKVMNKADLATAPIAGLAVSALTGAGLPALRAALEARVTAKAGPGQAAALTRPRHRAALADAVAALDEVAYAPLPEIAAEALRTALLALGRLTGAVGTEAILDLVFSEFCIGK